MLSPRPVSPLLQARLDRCLQNTVSSPDVRRYAQLPEVVATVNGEVITVGALNAYLLQQSGTPDEKLSLGALKEARDMLIMTTLSLQDAHKRKIVVSDDEVDQAFRGFERAMGSAEAFNAGIRRMGLTREAFRADLRRKLTAARASTNIDEAWKRAEILTAF